MVRRGWMGARVAGLLLVTAFVFFLTPMAHVMMHEGAHCWYNHAVHGQAPCKVTVHSPADWSQDERGWRAWSDAPDEPAMTLTEHAIVWIIDIAAVGLLWAWPAMAWIRFTIKARAIVTAEVRDSHDAESGL